MLSEIVLIANSFIGICYFIIAGLIVGLLLHQQQHLLKKTVVIVTWTTFLSCGLGHSAYALAIAIYKYNISPILLSLLIGLDLLTAIIALRYIILRTNNTFVVEESVVLTQTRSKLAEVNAEVAQLKNNLETLVAERTIELLHANQKLTTEIVDRQLNQCKYAEEELQRQNQRSQLVAEITLKIRQSLQIEEILQTTVTEVRQLLKADRVLVYKILPDASGIVFTESVISGISVLLGNQFPAEVFPQEYHHLYCNRQVKSISNVENADMTPCLVEFLQQFGVKAKLVVPILEKESLWGLLIVHQCDLPRYWSQFEIELLQQLADQVGIALTQAQIFRELGESEKKYRSVVENSHEVIFQTDIKGAWTFLNPAWTKITGFSVAESLGNNCLNYIHPDDQQILDLEFWIRNSECDRKSDIPNLKSSCRHELRYLTKNGEYHWVDIHAQLNLAEDDNTIIGLSGTLNDISERKRAEEEVHNALIKEKELSELKSRFVSMTSHEFRTPLTTILASAELLKYYGHKLTDEKKVEHYKRIQSSVSNMTELLNYILVLGKAEAGKIQFHPASLDLEKFCRDLVEEMELNAGKNKKIYFSIVDQNYQNLPAQIVNGETKDNYHTNGNSLTTESVTRQQVSTLIQKKVYSDEKLLRHIFCNLLSNALKYSPQNSTVSFELCLEKADAIFMIKDRGIGIPASDQERLFDSFHRAKNVGNIPGTGLGLTVVKKCVELHGGSLMVSSEVGFGTTFRVTIPINNQPESLAAN